MTTTWPWTVDLQVGPGNFAGGVSGSTTYTWTAAAGDPAGYGLTDDLRLSQFIGEDELVPAWPQETLTFGIVAAEYADVAAVVQGKAVDLIVSCTGVGSVLVWSGIVQSVVATPHRLGVLLSVTAVDMFTYLAGAVRPSGATLPAQGMTARMTALWAYFTAEYGSGVSLNYETPPTTPAAEPTVAALTLDGSATLLDLIRSTLTQWVVDMTASTSASYPEGADYARYYLKPNVLRRGLGWTVAQYSWTATLVNRSIRPGDLPGKFGPTPEAGAGTYGVVVDVALGPTRSTQALDAARVEAGGTYTQRPGTLPTVVQVSSPVLNYAAANGDTPRVVAQVDTQLTDGVAVIRLADLYLPAEGGGQWWADTFTWRVHEEPAGGLWATTGRWPEVGTLLAIQGVLAAWNPVQRPWYAGTVIRRDWRFLGNRPRMDLTLRPEARRVLRLQDHLLSFANMRLDWPSVTLAQLNARDTLDDLRLARK